MPFRGAIVSRGMFIGVTIDQTTNDSYFPTQKKTISMFWTGYLKIYYTILQYYKILTKRPKKTFAKKPAMRTS